VIRGGSEGVRGNHVCVCCEGAGCAS
jgi:hypothetical protein